MGADPPIPHRLKSRKQPAQARSEITVEGILEAVIQVLLTGGLGHLTTTRVAKRAGVSVGTLYQYFPNKEALLFAVLTRHFEAMANAFEYMEANSGKIPLSDVSDRIADAYVMVKMARPDITSALYRVAGAIDQFRMAPPIHKRLEASVVNALQAASDATFDDPQQVAFTLLSALAGLSRGAFGAVGARPKALDQLREEARRLSRAYLLAARREPPNNAVAEG